MRQISLDCSFDYENCTYRLGNSKPKMMNFVLSNGKFDETRLHKFNLFNALHFLMSEWEKKGSKKAGEVE